MMPVTYYRFVESSDYEREQIGWILEEIAELCREKGATIVANVSIGISEYPAEKTETDDFEISPDGSVRRLDNGLLISSSLEDVVAHIRTRRRQTGGWGTPADLQQGSTSPADGQQG